VRAGIGFPMPALVMYVNVTHNKSVTSSFFVRVVSKEHVVRNNTNLIQNKGY